LYIEKLEDENVEKTDQLEVFLKFQEDYDELKEKHKDQTKLYKELKIEKIQFELDIKDLQRNLDLKNLRIEGLEKRVENEETGRVRLENKQEEEAFQEQEYKEKIKELERQLILQQEDM
jgi:chromosome segregation ATPase